MGLITALGRDVPTCWARLIEGANGIGPITYFDATRYGSGLAAEVTDVPAEPTGLDALPLESCRRTVRLFVHGVREAWADAALPSSMPRAGIGVAVGISATYLHNGLLRAHYRYRAEERPVLDVPRFVEAGLEPAFNFHRRLADVAAAVPAKILGVSGPSFTIDSACAGSAHAIGEAFRAVRDGRAEAMVAGGASALVSPVGVLAFSLLGALSTNRDPDRASRPFDRRRDGFIMGEAGGAVVLERLESARARGAKIYGEVCGFGSTTTAQSLTQPSAGGVSEAEAMRRALDDAAAQPGDVQYVAAHGTSTPRNDEAETTAIKRVFGAEARSLLVSSNKGQIGHTIAAAGVCNLVAALKAIGTGVVPPTAHYREPDPACDLDYVPNASRRHTVRTALVNAFAFGGQNASLVVRGLDEEPAGDARTGETRRRDD